MHTRWRSGVSVALLVVPMFAAAQVSPNADVEPIVRAKFSANPVMAEIARCESKFRQYTDSGNPLFGGMDGGMVGVFQIYYEIHTEAAAALGMDLLSLDGNISYAQHLFEKQGTSPWMSSFPCWGKEVDVPPGGEASAPGAAALESPITLNLSLGMVHPQVKVLQQILNEKGYTIATDGPGSLGQETEKFGSLTRTAVRAFQCAQKIACSGDEGSTGWGFVGTKTRAALASLAVAPPPSVTVPDPVATTSATSSVEAQIIALQKQIIELTAILQALLAVRQ